MTFILHRLSAQALTAGLMGLASLQPAQAYELLKLNGVEGGYDMNNAGLVVAEIELQHADEPFLLPAWAGRQVTESLRYYNLALASYPYSQWSGDERAATDIP